MGYVIKDMKQLNLSDDKLWGNKIVYLSDAQKKGISIPSGFGVAFDFNLLGERDESFQKDVSRHFMSLKERAKASRFIVRSSAQNEDRKNHAFPGLYQSMKNLTTPEDVMNAIMLCARSFLSDTIDCYKREMHVSTTRQEKICLLVQEQMEPEYSGVLFTKVPIEGYYKYGSYLAEIVKGHCEEMLQGRAEPDVSYIIDGQKAGVSFKRIAGSKKASVPEKDLLPKLKDAAERLMGLYGTELNIEWGYVKEGIVIFQIRQIHQQKRHEGDKQENPAEIGLKAEAMIKFRNEGLFPKKLLVIEPGKKPDEIKKVLMESKELKGPLTIRYSCSQELGLPRGFATDKESACQFIGRTYRDCWTVIIHESIRVCGSYELYLDDDKTILEHVPGMWETDSKIAADVWIFRKQQVSAYAVNYPRNAKYENAGGKYYQMKPPYTKEEMIGVAEKMYPYIVKIRKNRKVEEGNNLHFVEDEDGVLYFLNERKIKKVSGDMGTEGPLTVIESPDDFDKWDGRDILLKIDLERGQEILLKQFVPFLKRTNVRVFVPFGILSHPAILLREFGIEIFPEYTAHRKYMFELSPHLC